MAGLARRYCPAGAAAIGTVIVDSGARSHFPWPLERAVDTKDGSGFGPRTLHGQPGSYCAMEVAKRIALIEADRRAWDRALRPKRCALHLNSELRRIVASKLRLDWSPEQISAWLKLRYPDDRGMRVSHETIYRSLFVQARGVLKKELLRHLRTKRIMRKSKLARTEAKCVDGLPRP